MISFPIAFLAFVFGFGFLVFIHELGHFLVAKWMDIRCTQFALGFGPAMASWRKGIGLRLGSTEMEYEKRAREAITARGANPDAVTQEDLLHAADQLGLGETEYRLNYLPLGGYVKMLGQEDMDAAATSSDPRAFNSKSVGARFAVISAGVIMNMITGIVFFVVAFMAGVEFPPAVVGGVDPTMPAAQAYPVGHENDADYQGLRTGDRITHIAGQPTTDFTDVKIASALGAAETPIELTIQRDGEPQPLVYRVTPKMDRGDRLLSFGVLPPSTLHVQGVIEDTPTYEAGLRPGMVATAIDGQPVTSFPDYLRRITAKRGEPAEVLFRDPDTGDSATIQLAAVPAVVTENENEEPSILGFKAAITVIKLTPDSPAERAGLKPGDLLAEVGGIAWPTVTQVKEVVEGAAGRGLPIVALRDGEAVLLGEVTPEDGLLGIHMGSADAPVVGQTAPGSPAAALNLSGGSQILTINGQPVKTWNDVFRAFAASLMTEGVAAITVGYRLNAAGTPTDEGVIHAPEALLRPIAQARWLVPDGLLMPGDFILQMRREPVVAANPWDATVLGLHKTKQFIAQAYVMILRLAQNTVGVQHLRGPVGIVDEGTKVAQSGWSYLLYFLGLLSVNLAVINFLPIPIADGGHAVFLLAEKIKGSPVSPKVQIAAMYVGLLLIGGVFLLVTYHDIARLAGFGS